MSNRNANNRDHAQCDRNSFERKAEQILRDHQRIMSEAKAERYHRISRERGYFVIGSESEQPRINALIFGVDRNAINYCKP